MARSSPLPSRPATAHEATDPSPSYEAALAELETLVTGLESGQWPLDRLLDGYRRGAELLAFCRDRLQAVEQQVQVLEADQLKPWKDA
ncbi:exodeoxyribonuclease VII small subunit [Piscinibacter sp. Jin2]|uniref:Exodeoxyribonuclease 7 small subunit n=1 Tax=Aquariibacter lacus TaxID=2801332 RepID=A0A9X0XCQ0_9BURK|nr:exodeoxyribonuclease VII small subunit [Piscinibacter lacus]MBL0719339.1 exodeoxyribonuclease VII small subunit [Piscinibacter lacus]